MTTGYDVDVLVAGGGPVGLATAVLATRAGFSTLVVERRHGPVDKACGEGLMPGALAAVRAVGADPSGRDFFGIRYVSAGGEQSAAARFAAGHDTERRPVGSWDLPTLAGAGAFEALVGLGAVEARAAGSVGRGPRMAGSIAQVTLVFSVPRISRSRREPGPMALIHAAVLAGLSVPCSAGSGSSVSGTSQAMDNGSYALIAASTGRNVCRSPSSSVAAGVVPSTSTRSGRTAKGSPWLIAVAGMVRVNVATEPGARVLPSEVRAT